jgi:hypothetical protein
MQPCWPARPRVRTRTLRRLIESSVVVGPAGGSRRHEVRLGWSSADGAGSGRRGGRPGYKPGWGLDPHRLLPVEPTVLASPRSLSQFGLVRFVSAGRRADAARLRRHRQGPLGPTSAGPSAAAAPCWERDPKRRSGTSRAARAGGGAGHLPAVQGPGKVAIRPMCPMAPHRGQAPCGHVDPGHEPDTSDRHIPDIWCRPRLCRGPVHQGHGSRKPHDPGNRACFFTHRIIRTSRHFGGAVEGLDTSGPDDVLVVTAYFEAVEHRHRPIAGHRLEKIIESGPANVLPASWIRMV